MKLARSVLIGAAFALAAGCADDTPKNAASADTKTAGKTSSAEHRDPSPAKPTPTAAKKPGPRKAGFAGLDRNSDGFLTRAEAKGNPIVAKNFKAADRNNDGKLNRAEYLAVVTKSDVKPAKTRAAAQSKTSAHATESSIQPP